MAADATAIIQFIGKDTGLSAVLGASLKGFNNLTDSVAASATGMADYAVQTLSVQDALKATVGAATGATKSILDVASSTTSAYGTLINNSERTIKVADILGDSFTKLALSASGLGSQTSAINSVLQPTAGFFSDVAGEATGVGKAFTVINSVEKPLVGTLRTASSAASGLADVLNNLGGVGQFAANGLLSVSAGAASLAGIVGNVDTIGDFYKVLEQLKVVAPEVAQTLGDVGAGVGTAATGFVKLTDASTEAYLAAQVFSKVGTGLGKSLAQAYVGLADFTRQAGFAASILKTVSDAMIGAMLHANDFGKALDGIKNIGLDTYNIELVSSLGLVGEGLLFNTQASKEFANAAVAAFAKVQDSISYITTLGPGLQAGIPALSKQLGELVNGPLQNAITKGEAAAAMYQSLSAGIGAAAGKIKESGPFLEAALKLASGTETQAATTVETLAKVSYAYSLNVKDATTTAAKLNGVVEEGIITFPQLAGNIGRVAGVAAQAKVPLNEMLGSIAALTKTMSGDDAMTGYVSLLNSIAGAGDQSKKAASELGVQFDIQAIKAKGLLNVLKDLYDKSGGNLAKIKEIIPDSLAFGTSLNLMTTAFKEAKEKTDAISKKTGTDLEAVFGARQQSLIKQTTALVNGFQEVLADFGEKFAENLQPGLTFLRGILERFKDLPEPIKFSIGAIVGLNAALEKAQGFIGILMGAVTQLVLVFVSLRAIAIVMSGELKGQLAASLGQVFDAFKAGSGRVAALTSLFETFTGSAQLQAKAMSGLSAAQEQAGRASRVLKTDIGQLAKEYANSAIAAEKAAIANKYVREQMQNPKFAKAAVVASAPVRENAFFKALGIPNLDQIAKDQAAKYVGTFVEQANLYADKVVGKLTLFDKAKLVAGKAFSDLGKAADGLVYSLTGINSATLKGAAAIMATKEAAAGATGAMVLYNEEFAKTQLAAGNIKSLANSFIVYNSDAIGSFDGFTKRIRTGLQELGASFQNFGKNLSFTAFKESILRAGNDAAAAFIGLGKKVQDSLKSMLTGTNPFADIPQRLSAMSAAATGFFQTGVASAKTFGQALQGVGTNIINFGKGIDVAKLKSIDWGATIQSLPANLSKLSGALGLAKTAQEQATLAEIISAQVKAGLILPTTALTAVTQILTGAMVGLWASMGPMILIAGAATVAFQAIGEVVAFDIMGFKSAAAKSQEYAEALTRLSDSSEEFVQALDAEGKAVEKNSQAYAKRSEQLRKALEKESDPQNRKAIQERIEDMEKLEATAKKAEERKYDGFLNNFLIPASEGVVKFVARLTPLSLKWKEVNNAIGDFFRDRKEDWQSFMDDRNGIYAALEENQSQVDALYQKSINAAQVLSKGSPITKEARDIVELAKSRKFSADELVKITKVETQAYEAQKKAIEGKVSQLQEALKQENNPERKKIIQQQIKDLNDSSAAYEKNVKAIAEYINATNDMRGAILGNKSPAEKLKELRDAQEKQSRDLVNQINSAKDGQEKALRENQQAAADGNIKVLDELQAGMSQTGDLQKKQLNSLLAAYKEFSDNASRVEMGATFQDLNTMRTEADKAVEEIEKNLDNLSGAAAESMIDAILNQKIRLKNADIAGSILGPDQVQAALATLNKIYEKSAQEQIDLNERKIDVINHLEKVGIKRQTLAQKEVLDLDIKNDEQRLEVKRKYIDFLVSRNVIGKESLLYKNLNKEIIQLEYQLKEKRVQLTGLSIDDREKLLERGNSREQALLEKAIATRYTTEADGENAIFALKQKNNLEQRKLLVERIKDLKSRGGDFSELETELIKLQTEFEKNITENSRRLADKRKAQIANEGTAVNQVYQRQLSALDLVSQKMQRQQDLLGARVKFAQAEIEINQQKLELQLRLTGDIEKTADIEFKIAEGRFKNLDKTQLAERLQAESGRKLQKIALEKEVISNRMAKAENERAIASLKIDIIEAKRQNRSAEELKSLEQQLDALGDKDKLLSDQAQGLEETKRNQDEINASARKELDIRQEVAREGGAIDLQLAKNKKLLAVYEKQKETAELAARQIEAAGNVEITRAEALTKIYERQSSVLESQKSRLDSRTNRLTGELQIAMDLTNSEIKKRDLAQAIAQIKYRSLLKQQELERKVLDIQELQTKAAERREEIQLRSQQAQNKAEVIGAYAELQKTLISQTATTAEKIIAKLNLDAKLEAGAAIAFDMSQIPEKQKVNRFLMANQRGNLEDQQSMARTQGQTEIIGTMSPTPQAIAGRQLRREILSNNIGATAGGQNENQAFERLEQGNRVGAANIFGGRGDYDDRRKLGDRAMSNYGTPAFMPGVKTPDSPSLNSASDYDKMRMNFFAQMQEFLVPIASAAPKLQNPTLNGTTPSGNKDASNQPSQFGDVTLQIEAINVTVKSDKDTPEEGAKEVRNAILDELYGLANKVKKKLK